MDVRWIRVLPVMLALLALPVQGEDLTGRWRGNDGGVYYLRQVGSELWAYGENAPSQPAWSNVMHGVVYGKEIRLQWADVPKGRTAGSGYMHLELAPDGRLIARHRSAGFAGSEWVRETAMAPPPAANRIESVAWMGMAADKVGDWGQGRPDGRPDGHFALRLDLGGPAEIVSIALHSANEAGNPTGGQVWHSRNPANWMLGVFRDGRQVNASHVATLGVHGGRVGFDLYANDSGWFRAGQSFLVEVELADGTKLKSLAKVAAAPAAAATQPAATPTTPSATQPAPTKEEKDPMKELLKGIFGK